MGISERMGDVLGQAVEAKLLREVLEHPLQVNHLAIIMDGNRRFASVSYTHLTLPTKQAV